jgi:hypothetical protein
VSLGPLYIATERFDAAKGSQWDHYIAWSGLSQLREVVTLDAILCPRVIKEILPEDWNEIVNEDFMTDYFISLDYLMQRAGSLEGRNLLCVYKNPDAKPSLHDARFQFEGYDLIDVRGGDLNGVGLLPALDGAETVRQELSVRYSSHHHAICDVWAIFRMRQGLSRDK